MATITIQNKLQAVETLEDTNLKESRTNKRDLNKYASLAQKLLESDKIYLNPSLSLYSVADILKIPAYRLSSAMAYQFGKNYHEIITIYRVEHAKKLLLSPAFTFFSIDGIGTESGFGNKTTF
ncbi:MAG: hypothetical protein K2Q22_06205, partial [Cytophagales bacterium]|nr:hypothetical protein [Cytophagales bacterium]